MLVYFMRSIERNPVQEKSLAIKRPWEYEWSSAKAYVNTTDDGLVEIALDPVWQNMGRTDATRSHCYRKYLLSPRERVEDEQMFNEGSWAIGDEGFLKQLLRRTGRITSRRVGRPRGKKP